jgi:hypothetical protein
MELSGNGAGKASGTVHKQVLWGQILKGNERMLYGIF